MSSTASRVAELRLRSSNSEASAQFLRQLLPQLATPPPCPGVAKLTFSGGNPATQVQLPQDKAGALPAFWKFSVFSDDIVELAGKLQAADVAVTDPVQFGDIGYLCHLQEPGSNSIELIQRTFEHNPSAEVKSPHTLGLITLRVSDPDAAAKFYVDALEMRLLATMAIDDGRPDPFDLYFFGYSGEPTPDSDPAAVTNREWLYQRQQTFIELQHYRPPTPALQPSMSRRLG